MKKRVISIVALVILLCSMSLTVGASKIIPMYCENCLRVTEWCGSDGVVQRIYKAYCPNCRETTTFSCMDIASTYTCMSCGNYRWGVSATVDIHCTVCNK